MSLAHAILAAGPYDTAGGTQPRLPDLLGGAEAEWLAALQSDDAATAERAFNTIYHAMYARLVALSRGYVSVAVAEELVQDVLARLWDRRQGLASDTAIGIYLYTATRNAAISAMRHDRVVGRLEHQTAGTGIAMGTMGASAQHRTEVAEVVAALTQALAHLPEGMRTAFTLRWVHELSYPEVAAVMGIAEAAARKQVSRAREVIVPVLRKFVGE